jgi:hypothetical protein
MQMAHAWAAIDGPTALALGGAAVSPQSCAVPRPAYGRFSRGLAGEEVDSPALPRHRRSTGI